MVQQWLEYFSHSLMSRSLWASLLQQRIKDIISAKVVSICGHNFLGKIRPRSTTKTRLLGRMHSVGCLFSLELLLSSSSLVFAVWLRWMLWKSISCITSNIATLLCAWPGTMQLWTFLTYMLPHEPLFVINEIMLVTDMVTLSFWSRINLRDAIPCTVLELLVSW